MNFEYNKITTRKFYERVSETRERNDCFKSQAHPFELCPEVKGKSIKG